MLLTDIPFSVTDWSTIEPTEHPGVTGVARWHTRQFGAIRVRLVEYSANYRADHWCSKGHILFCVTETRSKSEIDQLVTALKEVQA